MGYRRSFDGKLLLSNALTIPQYREFMTWLNDPAEGGGAIVDPDLTPAGFCCWRPNETGEWLEQVPGINTYDDEKWLRYLIRRFFKPWNITLSGTLKWSGQDVDDIGIIIVEDSMITVQEGTQEARLGIWLLTNMKHHHQREDIVVIAYSAVRAKELWTAEDDTLNSDEIKAEQVGWSLPDKEEDILVEYIHHEDWL